MSTAAIPASAGPVAILASHNGRYMGYSVRETAGAAATIRLWSGRYVPATGEAQYLDEIALPSNGTADFSLENPMNGEQYIDGIYVELVAGAMPSGVIRFRGPHS